MEFGILGALEAVGPAGPVTLNAPKHRALLAMLLLCRDEPAVSVDRLVDALWDEPPASAHKLVQVYVSQVRNALGDGGAIVTRSPGYAVVSGPLDLDRFTALAAQARAAARPEATARLLREALALFRGSQLADAPLHGPAAVEPERLEGLRLGALEDRIAADLALGRHAETVAELESLVAEHPYRERLHGQLMLALYRAGRQADALAAYRRARELLVDELGLDPGRELRELEAAILAPSPSLDLARAQPDLPLPATPLLGCAEDLEAASALLADPGVRLLTLTGPGGVGKSRLGLELAHRHGGRFVTLGAVDEPERVVPSLAQALGAAETGDDAPFAALAAALAATPGLVVVDNFEQVLDAAPELARLLAGVPGLKLLVTSRGALRIAGEHELALEPAAAVELFLARARAGDPRLAPDAAERERIATICTRLDCLPLAIELAAARTRLLGTASILERLERRLDLLTSGARDAPERQRTLRAAIAWSYDLLDPESRTLFAELGVFAGGWTLDAAEAVCGPAALDGLAALAEQSLVTRRDGRFGMLETVREYALERLGGAGGLDAVRARHAGAFVSLFADAVDGLRGADAHGCLERLDAERENVHAALEFALAAGDAEAALALVTNAWRHWMGRGNLTQGRALAEAALALDAGPPAARASVLNAAGTLAAEQGDYPAARAQFAATGELSASLGDAGGVARAEGNLGSLALYAGDHAEAVRRYTAAADYMRAVGNHWIHSLMLQNLGLAHDALGDREHAIELLRESLAMARRTGEPTHVASALRTLARLELQASRDPDGPTARMHESLEVLREHGDRHGIPESLETLAGLAEPEAGAQLLGAAAGVRATIGAMRPPDEEASVAEVTAAVQAALGEPAYAAAVAEGRGLDLDAAIALGLATARPAPR